MASSPFRIKTVQWRRVWYVIPRRRLDLWSWQVSIGLRRVSRWRRFRVIVVHSKTARRNIVIGIIASTSRDFGLLFEIRRIFESRNFASVSAAFLDDQLLFAAVSSYLLALNKDIFDAINQNPYPFFLLLILLNFFQHC